MGPSKGSEEDKADGNKKQEQAQKVLLAVLQKLFTNAMRTIPIIPPCSRVSRIYG